MTSSPSYWILIGMMASGKSSIGREIALHTKRSFVDLDKIIEWRLGNKMPQIFERHGEPAMREHETLSLKMLRPCLGVIATGGGVVLQERNWEEMRRLGKILFLDVSLEVLKKRLYVSRENRPLLKDEDWEERLEELYHSRRPLYLRADVTVALGESSVSECVHRVIEVLQR